MRRAVCSAALALAFVALGVPPASAASAGASRLQLGLGAGFTVGLGDARVARGDAIGFEGPVILMQLSLTPAYRISPAVALGLRGSFGSDLGSRGSASSSGESLAYDRNLWEAAATLRYQAEPGRGGYIGVSAGAAALVDSEGDASAVQWALPALGVAVGYDFELARAFAFGLEARAAYADFSGGGAWVTRASGESSHYSYDTSVWLGLALVGTLLQ
jgi:hypothetical protein